MTTENNTPETAPKPTAKRKEALVFLGGTCGSSTWRDELMPMLDAENIKYHDPRVEVWDDAAQKLEHAAKDLSTVEVFIITPEVEGFFSIAEAVETACEHRKRMIFGYLPNSATSSVNFSAHQTNSLDAICKMLKAKNVDIVSSLEEVVAVLKTIK